MGGENQFRVDFRNTENNPFMLVLGWDYPSASSAESMG
jgi:hypothetical protein